MVNRFLSIIGQSQTKKKLNFHLDVYNKTNFLPPLFLIGSKGHGKTSIAREICEYLKQQSGGEKNWIELNGTSVRKLSSFVNDLILPEINNKRVTLFVDEFHKMDLTIRDWLLSVFSLDSNYRSSARFQPDINLEFDFRQFSFIAASTNQEKLSSPLMERLKVVELEQYTKDDLVKILFQKAPEIEFIEGVENDIVSVSRGSPRLLGTPGGLAEDIIGYCQLHRRIIFGNKDWESLKQSLGIHLLGLQVKELELLRALTKGSLTLTCLAAKLGLDSKTVQKSVETYLHNQDLIRIDGKRFLTHKGRQILEQIDL